MNGIKYLACPYSDPDPAVRELRFRAVNRAAAILMSRGVYVFSPISHCHPIAEAGGLPTGFEYWEGYDRVMIAACDGLIVLDVSGWEESQGVQAEIKIAQAAGIPVSHFTLDDLND